MRYAAWLTRPDGTPSPAGPSYVTASGIVHAQRKAAEILQDLQATAAGLSSVRLSLNQTARDSNNVGRTGS